MKKDRLTPKAQTAKKPKASGASNKNVDQAADAQRHLDYLMPIVSMEVQSMAEAASKGDYKAVHALHYIAVKAANALNALTMSQKREMAKTTEWWPVNLSWVPSWNRVNIVNLPTDLGLGKAVNAVVDLEAILKRGAPTSMLGSYLIIHVEECRRFGMLLRRLKQKTKETAATELTSDEQKLLVSAFNQVRRITSAVASFMNLELPKLTQDQADAEMVWTIIRAESALLLRPLMESRDSRLAWFDFGMKLVEELSGEEYDRTEFGLTGMNRKGKLTGAPQVRAGIRQGIQEGFNAVIRNVSTNGFVVVS